MTTQAITKPKPLTTIANYIDARKGQIQKVMAAGMDIERITKIAIAAVSRTPKLMECSPESIYLSIHTAVQLGLEPGSPFGEAYLVPYKNNKTGRYEAQFIPGYQGLVKLARNSGAVTKMYARVVKENDAFTLEQGINESLVHKPLLRGDRGAPLIVYAVAHIKDAEPQFEWMTVAEVEAIRSRSKSSASGPWVTDWEEMAKKTVFKRLAKWIPKATTKEGDAFGRAVEIDNGADLEPVIDVTPDKNAAKGLPEDTGATPAPATRVEAEKEALRARKPKPEEKPAPAADTKPADAPESFEARRIREYTRAGKLTEARSFLDKATGLATDEAEALEALVSAAENDVR